MKTLLPVIAVVSFASLGCKTSFHHECSTEGGYCIDLPASAGKLVRSPSTTVHSEQFGYGGVYIDVVSLADPNDWQYAARDLDADLVTHHSSQLIGEELPTGGTLWSWEQDDIRYTRVMVHTDKRMFTCHGDDNDDYVTACKSLRPL
jgi:hypothetical protein